MSYPTSQTVMIATVDPDCDGPITHLWRAEIDSNVVANNNQRNLITAVLPRENREDASAYTVLTKHEVDAVTHIYAIKWYMHGDRGHATIKSNIYATINNR